MASTTTTGGLDTRTQAVARDLILVLADSKRLLGMRYAEWILGAPELEAGIACASMAQDEWGHARLLYALLKEFGDDVDRIEHGRDPADYRSMTALDRAPESWVDLIAMNVLCDGALSVQLEALRDSSWQPLRQRVGKLLEEETFHAAHGAAWWRRFATGGDAARGALHSAVERYAEDVLVWFGSDGAHARTMLDASLANGAGSTLRKRFLERIAPLVSTAGVGDLFTRIDPDLAAFDDATRRAGGPGPDAETIRRVRGDRNRAFLMD